LQGAEKFTASGADVTRDFHLQPGARITGTVTATGTGTPIPGITMRAREFYSQLPQVDGVTAADGTYTMHVAPGDYFITALNTTTDQPFATQLFSNAANADNAQRVHLSAGTPFTASFVLAAGKKLSGTITDPASGTPVPVPGAQLIIVDGLLILVEAFR